MNKLSLIKKLKYILSLIGCFILFLIIRKAGWNNIIGILSMLSPSFLCLAILAWILNLVIGALRFKKFLSTDLKFLEIFKIYLFGALLNYAAPIQGLGIGARVGMLKMKQVSVSRASAGIGSEIIYDIGLSTLISIIGLLIYGKVIIKDFPKMTNLNFFILPVILAILMLAIIWFLRKSIFMKNFTKNILRSISLKNLVKNTLITLGLYSVGVLMVFSLYKSIGITINPLLLLFASRISYLFGLLSLIPGGLGVRDAITGYICSLAGIPIHTTLSIAVIGRFMCLMVIIAILLIIGVFKKMQNMWSHYAES